MTLHRSIRTLAFSGLVLAATLPGAFAQDAAAFEARLKAALAEQGLQVSWNRITPQGTGYVLEGVTFRPAATPNAEPLGTVGTITLQDVTEDNGGYRIGLTTFPTYSTVQEGIAVDVSALTIAGLRVPAEGSADPLSALMLYDAIDLASLSLREGNTQLFSLTDLHVEMSPPEAGSALEFSGAAEKFTLDLSTAPDPQTKAVLSDLGYTQMSGFLEMAGSWQPSDGTLSLSQYDIAVENAGTLGLTFDLGGYTPAFIKSLQDLQKQMAAQPDGADNTAQGLAMLGLMQQITFNGMSLRFDDDSLTQKIIDYVAKQQNVSADDIKNQAKAIVPFLTAQLDNPELSQQVSTAVNAFLDNPQSIEIAAEPATPVPFAQLAATATANPLDLTKSLGLSVTANVAEEPEEGGAESGGEGQAQ